MYCSILTSKIGQASIGIKNARYLFTSISKYRGLLIQASQSCNIRQKHQVSYKPYVAPCHQDHDHKNMALKRPMSPHLTIYAPTLTATTSIMQRITGTILTFYALLLSGGTLFLPNGIETYVSIIQSLDLSRSLLFLVKLLTGIPFAFHYFNGMRYLMWTLGKGLTLKEVYKTAYMCFVAAGIVTLFFAFL